jgi:glycosyltransferase involved in cell wall biosynthesis
MTQGPLVSVLICAYDAERFIEETLRSVWQQSYENIEILVLDNNSRDRTYARLLELGETSPMPMRVMKSPSNLGVPGGLNTLLDQASGSFAAILDHDDLWHKDKIHLQVDFLQKHAKYPGCGGQIYVWWERNGKVSLWKAREHDSHTFHGTLMFRIRKAWRYDPALLFRADAHFTDEVLCAEGRQLYNFQRPLTVWRIRADGHNLSRRWNTLKPLWLYWRRTHNHIETLKGLVARILPRGLFDYLLHLRHSVSEIRVGDAALEGFPPPVGPEINGTHGQVRVL